MSNTAKKINPLNCSGNEAGLALGTTRQALHRWAERGCPRDEKKRFCLPEVFAWRLAEAEAEATLANSGGDSDRDPELRRWRKIRADREALRLEEDQARLLPREAVEERETRIATVFRQSVWSLPRRLAAELEGLTAADIEVRLREAVEEVLDDLSGGRN